VLPAVAPFLQLIQALRETNVPQIIQRTGLHRFNLFRKGRFQQRFRLAVLALGQFPVPLL